MMKTDQLCISFSDDKFYGGLNRLHLNCKKPQHFRYEDKEDRVRYLPEYEQCRK